MLYAINGGKDEVHGNQVGPCFSPITSDYLTYEEFWPRFDAMMRWLAKTYVNALKIIHYMHDKSEKPTESGFIVCFGWNSASARVPVTVLVSP